jgi:hypothetical protein
MPTQRQEIDALLKRWGEAIATAFREDIAAIKSRVVLAAVIDRLKANDLDGAVEAMHLERAAFAGLEDAIAGAFRAGGTLSAQTMPVLRSPMGARLVVLFNVRDPATEGLLRNHSSELVTAIEDDQRTAIRSALASGMEKGRNPTATALDVVGRINPVTKRREGGIVGLTEQQSGFVDNARDEMLSGDPAKLKNYLGRQRRDKRFDKTVEKAIAEGKPLPADTVAKMTGRYADSLLKLRGDVIAKDQTFWAVSASKDESYRQAIDAGKVQASAVKKRWKHFPNEHPRVWHVPMNNVEVGFDQSFTLPDGTVMKFAHDPAGGARNNLGCHCQTDYIINFFAGLT